MSLFLTALLASGLCSADPLVPAERPVQETAGVTEPSACAVCDAVSRFYLMRDGALAWTGPDNRVHYDQLLDAIRAARSHGLDPEHYRLSLLSAADPLHADPGLDSQATQAWLDLAHDLALGRLDPHAHEPGWNLPRRQLDLAARLYLALELGEVGASLEALAPRDEAYQRLRLGLQAWRDVAEKNVWPVLENGPALHPGDEGPRVAQLRALLEAQGQISLQVNAADRDVFDADMAAAILRMQRSAHLEDDGIVGAGMQAWLAIRPEARVAQIAANLERRRWRPALEAGRVLRVNIPDFRLDLLEDGRIIDQHRLIVGRTSRPTPIFSAELAYFIINPWWETPYSLAVRDELPAFRRDPDMVERLGFQVLDRETNTVVDASEIDWNEVPANPFPYRLRQAPGPHNALGEIKFIFPNPHNTYLHDTPGRHLFQESRRAFSSGCMRVDQPIDLAHWVAQGLTGWSPERIDEVAAGDAETRVDLTRRIPVHTAYRTVIPSQLAYIRFVADLYEKDDAIINGLSGGSQTDPE
ncbi:MAG: L,D-transpeptidase family protein [Alphaproteobacteria bacterium]|uniref:L,D-transpeptidase family protein n=1 Tax=Maricaulis alexandrii TaxID=2570354 RepID=UPI0011081F9D|nr:L,D-transpeptidase family protein [Maricaulis alexandrii]MCR9267383.1 L,D-transpeptidase family protein [Alphaproteobacteria bacterium]